MKCSYNKILLILVYLILSNFGCKPKDCHKDGSCAADNRVYPLGEAKNYLCFNKGSYWIYKNTKTGEEKPNRTYSGEKYYNGYSDHLSIYITLE